MSNYCYSFSYKLKLLKVSPFTLLFELCEIHLLVIVLEKFCLLN